MPRIEVTISIHMTVEGGCDVDNVAQLQALIFLLASPFNGLAVRLLIRICIDKKEVLPEEARMLQAFGGELKDSDSDVWFHSADSPNSLVSASVPKHKAAIVETIAAFSATLTGLEPATSAVTGRRANQLRHKANRIFNSNQHFRVGTPNGIRTRAAAVKGQCPRPLDDGGPSR